MLTSGGAQSGHPTPRVSGNGQDAQPSPATPSIPGRDEKEADRLAAYPFRLRLPREDGSLTSTLTMA